MGDKKIKIGIIGAGNIAQNSHIPAYLKQDDAEIIAICDINLDRAREVAAKHNIKYAVGSIEELVAIDEIDAVSICTWNNAHAKAAIAAANAGKHVLCEKPMAMTVAEAEEMKEAAEKNNIIFMMGFTNRFRSDSKVIKEMWPTAVSWEKSTMQELAGSAEGEHPLGGSPTFQVRWRACYRYRGPW